MPSCVSNQPLPRALALLALLCLVGCGDGDSDEGGFRVPEPNSSNLQGFFANEDGAGRMGVVISLSPSSLAPAWNASSSAVTAATGSLSLEGGGTVVLAGTYDTVLDSLHLAGVGYQFGGRVRWVNGVPIATGRFTSLGNDGAFAVALVNAFGPQIYCGRLFVTGDLVTGRVGFVFSGVEVMGAACFNGDADPVALEGEFDPSAPKPRFLVTGSSTTRAVELQGSVDEEAELSAGSWNSTGALGDTSGTWSAAPP